MERKHIAILAKSTELISFSDQALYAAKDGGRNRVEVYKD